MASLSLMEAEQRCDTWRALNIGASYRPNHPAEDWEFRGSTNLGILVDIHHDGRVPIGEAVDLSNRRWPTIELMK